MMFLGTNMNEYLKNELIQFNKKFSIYTKNYKLLVIIQIKNKEKYHENIDFLELHTESFSNGVNFINNDDNEYLNNIILTITHQI
jgi:hypothetical protein